MSDERFDPRIDRERRLLRNRLIAVRAGLQTEVEALPEPLTPGEAFEQVLLAQTVGVLDRRIAQV